MNILFPTVKHCDIVNNVKHKHMYKTDLIKSKKNNSEYSNK